MFSNKEKTQKTKVMEINVVAKNTTINGDIISEGDFRIDGILEGNIKTKGRVIIGVEGSSYLIHDE
jgi:cytoskeletal protein CcmA (bactofilin family)